MINVICTCDNCGRSQQEPLKLSRHNERFVLNRDDAGQRVDDLFCGRPDGWLAVLTSTGMAHYCPGCKKAAKLAIEADRTIPETH